MSDAPQTQPAGWYYAQGDPPGTQRYWDGQKWEGGPQPVPGAPQAAADGATLAEPINRIAARLIDYVLWLIVVFIIGLIFGVAQFRANADDVSYGASLGSAVVGTALVAGYEIFMVGSRGATLGKQALGLKVTRMDGSAPDFKDAAMRMAPYIGLNILGGLAGPTIGGLFGFVLIIIGIVSLVFLFTDSQRQTVWDKIAKTRVVTAK
jgi:uncharacterized RDD family membrane protein YckC